MSRVLHGFDYTIGNSSTVINVIRPESPPECPESEDRAFDDELPVRNPQNHLDGNGGAVSLEEECIYSIGDIVRVKNTRALGVVEAIDTVSLATGDYIYKDVDIDITTVEPEVKPGGKSTVYFYYIVKLYGLDTVMPYLGSNLEKV